MNSIEQLTAADFKNPELLDKINEEANDLIDHLMATEAYKMALELEKKLKELASQQTAEPTIYSHYLYILIRLKFLSLLLWDDETYLDLIQNYLVYILGSDIDICERMTGKLYSVPDLVWPELASQSIEALRQNNEPVGAKQLAIPSEQSPKPQLIKYWVLDYDRTVGTQKHENLERAQYFARSQNYKNLSDEDKIKIQQLLEFYDGLKPLPVPEEPGQEGEPGPLIAMPRQNLEGNDFSQKEEPQEPYFPESAPIAHPPSPPEALPIQQKAPPPMPKPAPSVQPAPAKTYQPGVYREEILPKDLAGPQAPPKPEPKLNGNVINLKEYGGQ